MVGAVECPVGRCQDRREEAREGAGEMSEAGNRPCERIAWNGIAREGLQPDHHHMGTEMSGDNNTIHRKVCMNHLELLTERIFDVP